MKTIDGRLEVISGSSRSGKTWWTSKAIKGARRILAWDPEDQWAQLAGWKKITTRAQLLAALEAVGLNPIVPDAPGNPPAADPADVARAESVLRNWIDRNGGRHD